MFNGVVFLPKEDRSIRKLRDTGGSQSIILASAIPFSDRSAGNGMDCLLRPMHKVHRWSKLVNGVYPEAIYPVLSIRSVTMLLGNYSADGRVIPDLQILDAVPHYLF